MTVSETAAVGAEPPALVPSLLQIRRRARAIHEGELERAGTVEVHRADGDAALIVEELRHLRVEPWWPQ